MVRFDTKKQSVRRKRRERVNKMLSEKMLAEFNQRVNDEMYAWYLYLAMAAHFESENFPGFAQWMRQQGQEEMAHAMKNFSYILERGGKVELKPIKEVPSSWASPLAAFECTSASRPRSR